VLNEPCGEGRSGGRASGGERRGAIRGVKRLKGNSPGKRGLSHEVGGKRHFKIRVPGKELKDQWKRK